MGLMFLSSRSNILRSVATAFQRSMSSTTTSRKALVLGLFKEKEQAPSFTKSTQQYLECHPSLKDSLDGILGSKFEHGSHRLLYDQKEFDVVCLTNLGDKSKEVYDEQEEVYINRENIRTSISKSIRSLVEQAVTQVSIDTCGDPEAASEAATLTDYAYDDFKTVKKEPLEVLPYDISNSALAQWNRGKTTAEGQILARWLMDSPSNFMTPTKFAQVAQEKLPKSCDIQVHGKEWIQGEKMNAFLAVAQGSTEPPVFVEVAYRGDKSTDKHAAFVGKGVTFDSGGISIKPSANMDAMRADMGGASCILGALYAVAKLELPVNVTAYIPLAENMPSGMAIKPGDVVTSRSGKSIQIDNTDAEGRLLLADALDYACSKDPVCVLDLATLTGAMVVALGAGATGTFSTSTHIWNGLHESAKHTGDRVWRMPLYKLYTSHMNKAPLADLNNIGGGGKAGACTAAAFLHQFVTCKHWAHLDIAGVMSNTDEVPYLSKGMAGRPTRTLVHFLDTINLSDYEQ